MSEKVLMSYKCSCGRDLVWSISKVSGEIVCVVEPCECTKTKTPSPTVEISLEDFNVICNTLSNEGHHLLTASLKSAYKQAISKAESKEPLKSMENGGIDVVFVPDLDCNETRDAVIRKLWADNKKLFELIFNIEDRLSPVTAKTEKGIDYLKRQRDSAMEKWIEDHKEAINKPALPIQDQVNELRKEINVIDQRFSKVWLEIKAIESKFEHTISQLQSVIEGIKGK